MSGEPPSPAEAIDAPEGDPTTQAAVEGADVDGDADVGSSSTLREMLLSTDPAPELREVESPYDPANGGIARVYRGVIKATGVDGLPAIADVVIGLVEAFQEFDLEADGDQEDVDDDDQELGPGGV